jgi:anti-sigma regulatory factor (Ser/Thr protein kinase)
MIQLAPTLQKPSVLPPLSATQRAFRIPLLADLTAAASARAVVKDTVRAWCVPVDADVAVLLTSELVTNAVTHGTRAAGEFVLLVVACDTAVLRVEVHDGSADLPVPDVSPADAEAGRGLLLVTSLSAEWGFCRTAAGKAVYFTLELLPGEQSSRSVS